MQQSIKANYIFKYKAYFYGLNTYTFWKRQEIISAFLPSTAHDWAGMTPITEALQQVLLV